MARILRKLRSWKSAEAVDTAASLSERGWWLAKELWELTKSWGPPVAAVLGVTFGWRELGMAIGYSLPAALAFGVVVRWAVLNERAKRGNAALEKRISDAEAGLARVAGELQPALKSLGEQQRAGAADLGQSVAALRGKVVGALEGGDAERAALARRIADVEAVAKTRLDQAHSLFERHYDELRSGLDALRTILGGAALPLKSVRFDPTTNDGTITLGAGVFSFSVHFFRQDSGQIGVSKAGTNLKELARVRGAESGVAVRMDDHDHSSRDYVVNVGEHFIAENEGGFFMIGRIEGVDFEGRAGADKHEVRFTYRVDVSGQPAVTAI